MHMLGRIFREAYAREHRSLWRRVRCARLRAGRGTAWWRRSGPTAGFPGTWRGALEEADSSPPRMGRGPSSTASHWAEAFGVSMVGARREKTASWSA